MDEPLAALDEARKAEILPYVERLRDQSKVPIVYVSHSIAEVARLASTVVLLSDGKVVAVGPTSEVMQRLDLFPLTGRAEAGALVEATVERHDQASGLTELRSRAAAAAGCASRHAASAARARTRRDAANLSALNILQGIVAENDGRDGPIVEIRIDCSGEALIARLTSYSVERLQLAPGTAVFALVKSVAFDRRSLSGPMHGSSVDVDASDA